MNIGKPGNRHSTELAITFKQERSNRYDCFAIVAMMKLPGTLASSIVGHIPREMESFNLKCY